MIENQNLFECSICLDYYIKPVSTYCGHNYCHLCIEKSLLESNSCPLCKTKIDINKLVKTKVLGKQTKFHVENLIQYDQLDYDKNCLKYKHWKAIRKVKSFKIGDSYDVRDTENIWCVAKVTDIISIKGHSDLLSIKYVGWDSIYDEVICSNSKRIAPLGFYTNLKDIPTYSN